MRQVLENNAGHRALFTKTALDNLPDTDKASGKAVFGKTRAVIIDKVRGKLGERLANSIATPLKPMHIKENRESHPKEEEATPASQASSNEDQTNDARNNQTHRQCH